MKFLKHLPWIAGACALLLVLAYALPARPVHGFQVERFAQLPVQEGGRVKPLDSIARNSLLAIRSQSEFRFEGQRIQADAWLLDLMFRPEVADRQPVFVINDPEVLGLMGKGQGASRYFSFAEIVPAIGPIEEQAQQAHAIDAKQRTRFQASVVSLYSALCLYHQLKNTLQPMDSPGLDQELRAAAPAGVMRYQQLASMAHFRILPPLPGQPSAEWQNTGEGILGSLQGSPHPALESLGRASAAWRAQDAAAFNRATEDLQTLAARLQPGAASQAGSEQLFNRSEPFFLGMVLYVFALLAVFIGWAWKPEAFHGAGFVLLVSGAVVHTLGLAFRILLQGRPPVTNLYSSAVFVGWAAVLLGILLERMHRRGFGAAVAAASGFASLLVAHHLSTSGDTMEMMRAVLDSNFWLGTHVVTITIGYSGTFVAGILALAYTLRKHLVADPDPETTRSMVSMTYGVICFSLFFSFVGTVLGGIWADQSWGRFWGWDPKENGALLLVLWNAIILHARWGGYARERGIMALAIGGNIVTSLSWFGVNLLGVGLHAYGFTESGFWYLASFVASQLLMIGLCLLPARFWASREA